MKIDDINAEISRLSNLRSEYYEKVLKETREEFLRLDWLKGHTFTFIEGSGAYGHREYVLRGFTPKEYRNIFDANRTMTLIGNSKNYMDNINVRRPYDVDSLDALEIYTCNSKAFIDFIKRGIKISLPFDFQNKLSVYEALNEIE